MCHVKVYSTSKPGNGGMLHLASKSRMLIVCLENKQEAVDSLIQLKRALRTPIFNFRVTELADNYDCDIKQISTVFQRFKCADMFDIEGFISDSMTQTTSPQFYAERRAGVQV